MTQKPQKPRKCRNKECGDSFIPVRALQTVCSPSCAFSLIEQRKASVRKKEEKAVRQDTKIKLDKLKTRAQWLKEAQSEFNKWIRARDLLFPCISCGRFHQGQYHAGHYRSVGAAPQHRFNEANVHKQCAPCNDHLSGNITEYRKGLIRKIGVEAVECLESDNAERRYTVDDAKRIKAEYREKLKQLKL